METVLVLTQNSKVRDFLKELLREEFFLFTTSSTQEAFKFIKEKPVDMVIVDSPLKDADFLEVIKRLKEVGGEIVILPLLYQARADIEDELERLEIYNWLVKPFQIRELRKNIKQAKEKSLLLQELRSLRKESDQISAKESTVEVSETMSERRESFPGYFYYQETIRKFSKALTYILDLPRLLDLIMTAFMEIFEVNKVSVLLREEKNLGFRVKASMGLREDIIREALLKEGEGISRWLSKEGRILRKDEISHEADLPPKRKILKEMEMLEAEVCLPLLIKGELIGIITVGKKVTGERFMPEDLRLLYTMANYSAVAIHNSLLYREVNYQRDYHQRIMESIPSGFLAIDTAGKIISINKRGMEILGIEEEVVGEDIQKAGSIIADIMLRTIQERKAVDRQEIRIPGRNLIVGTTTALIKNEKEEIIGAVMFFRDITEVKEMEEKLKQMEEESLWKKIAEGVAHGVRNPLVTIRTFAQLLPERYEDKEFRKEFCNMVSQEVERLDEVIENLEKFSESISLQLSSENIHTLLEEVLMEYKEIMQRQGIKVEKEFYPDIPLLRLDRNQLLEAFSQIVKNAIQAMEGGGRLKIITNFQREKRGGMLEIEFKDTGEGISVENLPKVFSPLFTTKFKGLGLGLPIARKIIEAHRGMINIQSRPRRGTSVKVMLPVEEVKEKVEELISQSLRKGI